MCVGDIMNLIRIVYKNMNGEVIYRNVSELYLDIFKYPVVITNPYTA